MATPAQPSRILWLLRHAKTVTDPPPDGTDFDRVLAPRGRRDATALGRLFAGQGEGLGPALKGVPRPQVALGLTRRPHGGDGGARPGRHGRAPAVPFRRGALRC